MTSLVPLMIRCTDANTSERNDIGSCETQTTDMVRQPTGRQQSCDLGDLGFGDLDQPQVHRLRSLGKQCIEATPGHIMRDYPNSADRGACDVKGHKQNLVEWRLRITEVGKVYLGMRAQLSGIAVQHRPARAEVPWRAAIQVMRKLASDCTPVEVCPLIAILQ